jgi:HEPN domain-containing protein
LDKRKRYRFPPYTHDLQKICDELTLGIGAEDYDFLSIMNSWNIRGRYPDYTKRLYQNTTDDYLKEQIGKVEILKKWLEEKILKQK